MTTKEKFSKIFTGAQIPFRAFFRGQMTSRTNLRGKKRQIFMFHSMTSKNADFPLLTSTTSKINYKYQKTCTLLSNSKFPKILTLRQATLRFELKTSRIFLPFIPTNRIFHDYCENFNIFYDISKKCYYLFSNLNKNFSNLYIFNNFYGFLNH